MNSSKCAPGFDLVRHPKFVIRSLLVLMLFLLAPLILSHDSPEHVIEALTLRMEAVGRQADLLWERATEYRALGDLAAAESDLKQALKVRPDFVVALQDRPSRIDARNTKQASRTINRALRLASDEAGRAPRACFAPRFLCPRRVRQGAGGLRCRFAARHRRGIGLVSDSC
jgi:tetratricopeptide (TPR) repeat protein